MKKSLLKSPRLKLNSKNYAVLRRQALERDNWRCQLCRSMRNLEVHHIKFRSQSGPDAEQNLVTLCASCHENLHTPSTPKAERSSVTIYRDNPH